MKKTLFLFVVLFTNSVMLSQNFNMSNTPVNSCTGNFFDSGGAGAGYTNNQTFTKTFCPTGTGNVVAFNFTAFELENNADFLYVYDGNSTSAPLLATLTGNEPPGVIIPTGNNTTGCLTFVFISDATTTAPGWTAAINCFAPCQTIQSVLNSTIPSANSNNIIRVCQGESVQFNGSATFSNSGVGATYTWSFDDGTTATGQSVTKIFDTPGVYRVNLTTRDVNNCVNSNFINQVVQVAPSPDLSIFTVSNETCMNLPLDLTANASNESFVYECSPPVSGVTFLPDGTGVPYSTSVVVDCFPSSTVLTNINQI
ncbi:MAG: PKD domain-containing protein, partial [Flavobacterium sp.]|nr:PKD domain-containing protein [Flavobacterium sp.]